jgi:hypothetical protein
VRTLFVVLFAVSNVACAERLRVAFVGNSFIWFALGAGPSDVVNDVPGLVEALAAARHRKVMALVVVTRGGATLEDHAKRRDLPLALEGKRADVVVLQEQSERPLRDVAAMRAGALALAAQARGARLILVETWPRAEAPEDLPGLEAATRETARAIGAEVAPVGHAFDAVRRARPDVPLYAGDRRHPSALGAYLAACVLYAVLYRAEPAGVTADTEQAAVELLLDAERAHGEVLPAHVATATLAFLADVAARTVVAWDSELR